MQFTLVIEKTIAAQPGKNISLSKRFELPFVPYSGLRLYENGNEYIISDRLTYNMDYRCFVDVQFEECLKIDWNVEATAESLKSAWSIVKIVKY